MTELHIYMQSQEYELIPKGYYFTIEKKDVNFKVKCYKGKTNPSEILNKKAKSEYTLNLSKTEVDEFLTMYAFRVYQKNYDGKLSKLIAMSKNDVMKIVSVIKNSLREGDEIYIYKMYGIQEQGQIAIKRYIKQGNRLVIGEL